MDPLIRAAARALSAGDPLGALKWIALRDDAPALALRGIAMAQMGDLPRARDLLRRAGRAFGAKERLARARCALAEAEIALVTRDLGGTLQNLVTARAVLTVCDDRANAAHAGYLEARLLLLIGRLRDARDALAAIDRTDLSLPSQVGCELVSAGIAMRRIDAEMANAALQRAARIAERAAIPALQAEVAKAARALREPVARLIVEGRSQPLRLDEVQALLASDVLVVDACRNALRAGATIIPLTTRPVLLKLLRALAEHWPAAVSRQTLLRCAFGARHDDDSHRVRLRVEIARLRALIRPLAKVQAKGDGYALIPAAARKVAVLAPMAEGQHGDVLALLSDGEAWSSSALALALNVSARTVQRALEQLAADGLVDAIGHGRARRWITHTVPGFPTSLLLPAMHLPG